MILPRDIYNASPPERRTRITNNPTLLYSWWCTIFSLVIIGVRLCGRYIRNNQLFREDKIMAWSIVPLLARMGCAHVVLIYGTNNVDVSALTDPTKIHHREIGARMVLAARVFYALFIWMAKFTVSEFLKRLTQRFWKRGYECGLRGIRIFLVLTFAAVLISTFAECQPFTHYWQVRPDPGPRCRQGYAQLLTMGVADIVTDVLLVAFPIPIIIHSGMPLKRKASLVTLFSMSVVLIVITGARMPMVIEKRGIQQFRSMFASSEILAATIVSNAIILGSFLRDRGVKKAKFKASSTTDSMERRGSTRTHPLQQCDSDENLARSLGYRTRPELSDKKQHTARPAPVANLDMLGPNKQGGPFAKNWQFPGHEGTSKLADIREPMPSPRAGSGRRVSFFDVGGLLENSSPTDSVITHDFASQLRRGSRASNSLVPNGRPYPPPARRSSRLSQRSEDYEMSTRPRLQLRDAGSLLSEDRAQKRQGERPRSSTSPQPGSHSYTNHRSQHRRTVSLNRSRLQDDQDRRSVHETGCTFSFRLSAPTMHTTLRTSFDGPSLQDAGGLLSSSSAPSKPFSSA